MQALISFISTRARILGPIGIAVTVLVPFTVTLLVRWLAGPLSVGAWVGIASGVLLLVPVLVVVTLVLRVTVFAPDWVERFPNGKVRARGPHYSGDRQGPWTFWHEDGWKECEGEYIAGFESGIWTFYHSNGQRFARGELDGWSRRGAWEFWDDTGRPLGEAEFLASVTQLPPLAAFQLRSGEPTAGATSQAEPVAAPNPARM